ncbi:MAG: hypothetical protein PW735_04995 [Acidobacteriaceae bacterium]|nr:hypothetical protein [Acidobacteriaceae bacterium]
MSQTLLLIAPETVSLRAAEALRKELDLTLDLAPNRRSGLALLRRNEYSLVLLDESISGTDPEGTDLLYQNAGSAPVLEIGFAITGLPRVVRQVKAALVRRAQDQARARSSAAVALQNELRASLSGLLLESQLALREATPQLAPRVRHLVELAGDLRDRLLA